MDKLEKVLGSCKDEMGRCHYKRGAVADKHTLVGKEHAALGKSDGDVLHASANTILVQRETYMSIDVHDLGFGRKSWELSHQCGLRWQVRGRLICVDL